jgi:4-phospho-D-threonate 3-dehydrogenase / 4-phospho-D-erythronate 3-dehydrogenase
LKPLLALVIGDPGGIGPEVCIKALGSTELRERADVALIGSLDVLRRAARTCESSLPLEPIATIAGARRSRAGVAVLDDGSRADAFPIGRPSAESGTATYRWIRRAVELAEAGKLDGLLIAPVDTTSFGLAKVDWLPEFEPDDCFLLRMTGTLRTIPIAEHVQMKDVPATVRRELVERVIVLIGRQLRTWGTAAPRIAVAGLNPHCAGEEEPAEIVPAIAAARAAGFDVTGPLSPDTIFRGGLLGKYDVIVTMYHDQGQIAVKTVGLEEACTIFVGLPYLRIGIPHGSAMDIAGTGTAQHNTTLKALLTAASLASGGGI